MELSSPQCARDFLLLCRSSHSGSSPVAKRAPTLVLGEVQVREETQPREVQASVEPWMRQEVHRPPGALLQEARRPSEEMARAATTASRVAASRAREALPREARRALMAAPKDQAAREVMSSF